MRPLPEPEVAAREVDVAYSILDAIKRLSAHIPAHHWLYLAAKNNCDRADRSYAKSMAAALRAEMKNAE